MPGKINIKTPFVDAPKPKDYTSSGGIFNGEEPGYQKRTTGGTQVPEKTYEKMDPKPGNLNVRTPASMPNGKGKK